MSAGGSPVYWLVAPDPHIAPLVCACPRCHTDFFHPDSDLTSHSKQRTLLDHLLRPVWRKRGLHRGVRRRCLHGSGLSRPTERSLTRVPTPCTWRGGRPRRASAHPLQGSLGVPVSGPRPRVGLWRCPRPAGEEEEEEGVGVPYPLPGNLL